MKTRAREVAAGAKYAIAFGVDTLIAMPRFGTKSLLIVFGLVAIWLSTFTGIAVGQDVRRSMLLLILVGVVCLACFSQGRRRVFWTTFAVVMALCGGTNLNRPLGRYIPTFAWENSIGFTPSSFAPVTAYPSPTPVPASPSPYQPPQIVYTNPMPYGGYRATAGGGFALSYPFAYVGMMETLSAGWTLALSAAGGALATYLFSRTKPRITPASLAAQRIVEQELRQ
jgi:hypothetical protein